MHLIILIKNKIINVDSANKRCKNINNIIGDNINGEKCHISPENSNLKVNHFIITRFMISFYHKNGFPKKMYNNDYIKNGVRVMKKYLLPSLEYQKCKDFSWILMVGDDTNISYIKHLFDFNISFPNNIVYFKDIKAYIKNNTKNIDVLITSRIDYDDIIYYDAVNDVRKAININNPLLLYGYNRGLKYIEYENKYFEFNYKKKSGIWSVFISLILVLNKVNNIYTIYDLGDHTRILSNLKHIYKSYGLKSLDYEPAVVDNGTPKFIWVKQNYSGSFNFTLVNDNSSQYMDVNLNKLYDI